ncbi:hypothetical protein SPRG_03554 [Saprolegnia parasitica CBS 223.65]|uniref:FYVE-type domain-containing protein n=1 Tax=Saprolegnia parasitica (strain CBS 223.65) TaxID=695850 RepID=A0A067CLR2_SAPPC|nr:hypothetical protein SPRG_03554 [Saprolegnia parasitica CBS 223.65]KDO31634.1 hypothetical protein SPRG_03554 [Saprolegnia parasitica CBS 223.65]|eukprot:XP_012197524.1 hypothetical protein SPRG_03554 [Saprolegnia parasitica CBS 223.65]
MAALFGPLPSVNRDAFRWIPDKEAEKCMNCNSEFTVFNRKHHCRRCGHVVCKNCSPNIRRVSPQDPFPVRVCNPCYTAVDEHFTSLEWSGHTTTEAERSPDPVANGRVHIGQLYVKVVEAIGLPSTDSIANSITSDPFVKVILTGRWSHGQEWGTDLQSIRLTKRKSRTLNPRWHETFVFNVCAPGAELVLEVYNSGQLGQPTKLGQAVVPLSILMDQRRHNKWLDLLLPQGLYREGLNNDARAGRIHVLLHYKFARAAEFVSHFAPEQPYEAPWPAFKAATLYSNFWLLLDDLWPYLEVLWAISPTLNWEHPSRTCFWLVLIVWMCVYIRWVPVLLHLFLIGLVLRNHFDMTVKLQPSEAPISSVVTPPSFNTSSSLEPSSSSSNLLDGQARVYNLPQGFHHITDKMTRLTTDAETRHTLQNVQNNMAWWSGVIKSIELLFSWEDFFYTGYVLIGLIVSCILHVVIPNQYLLLLIVLWLFVRWTVPYITLSRWLYGVKQGIRSLLHQHRLLSMHEQKGLMDRDSTSSNNSGPPSINVMDLNGKSSINNASNPRGRIQSISHRNKSVSKRELMIGAAAAELSKRIAAESSGGSGNFSSLDD